MGDLTSWQQFQGSEVQSHSHELVPYVSRRLEPLPHRESSCISPIRDGQRVHTQSVTVAGMEHAQSLYASFSVKLSGSNLLPSSPFPSLAAF